MTKYPQKRSIFAIRVALSFCIVVTVQVETVLQEDLAQDPINASLNGEPFLIHEAIVRSHAGHV